jgi:hypothetical protein
VLLLYVFLFYFFFLQSAKTAFSSYSSLARMNVTVSTVNYEITVPSSNDFYKAFNLTDRTLNSLVNMGCFINGYTANGVDYTPRATSSAYFWYAVGGILLMRKSVGMQW